MTSVSSTIARAVTACSLSDSTLVLLAHFLSRDDRVFVIGSGEWSAIR